jgi:hypothetical protein
MSGHGVEGAGGGGGGGLPFRNHHTTCQPDLI